MPFTTRLSRPKAAIIPAAGLGTRMRGIDPALPWNLPKEFLPVAGMPAIFHSLLLAMDAGITHAVVVLSPAKAFAQRLLEDPEAAVAAYPRCRKTAEAIVKSLTIHFCFQDIPRGECDALNVAWPVIREHAEDAPVAVIYPDNLVTAHPLPLPLLRSLAAAATATGLETVALMDPGPGARDDISDSGRVRLAPWPGPAPDLPDGSPLPTAVHEVTHFFRKGSGVFTPRFPGELRTCGIFAATDRWFAAIEDAVAEGLPNPGTELTDGAVRRLMRSRGERFAGVEIGDGVYDIGNPAGYRNVLARMGRGPCRAEVLAALCGERRKP